METPELDKILNNKSKSQPIGEFIEWLGTVGLLLAEYHEHNDDACFDDEGHRICGYRSNSLQPHRETIENLLARYFQIDLVKAEKERYGILEEVRKHQEHTI